MRPIFWPRTQFSRCLTHQMTISEPGLAGSALASEAMGNYSPDRLITRWPSEQDGARRQRSFPSNLGACQLARASGRN
jgi:hypothetical protein